ncbi:O-methyltransferase [Auraticoccus monumenti]|uniref:Predicted O-methyltransferase YrrM n=1 Tax=Auraticoccus monumenti TaxID=675864 RepID=A0A1G7ACK6_9ACTN|nr:class I SAM-dependent methyltransferase [Auraticoccus monumenti]SDE12552.1 Predicted O-methyltransferase YrrM [Auraticoccus monumenti]
MTQSSYGPSAPSPELWEWTETFVPESPTADDARRAALRSGGQVVSQGTASLLTLLARTVSAKAVVEIGTGGGVSGLALLSGMAKGGVLTSVDPEAEDQADARRALLAAGITSNRFRLITGRSLDVLPRLSDGVYDLVLVGGDKLEYVEYVAQALRLLRPGGLLVVLDVLWSGRTADAGNEEDETIVIREALEAVTETEDLTHALLPVGDGVLVAVRP